MVTHPDPAVLYPDIEAHGSLGAALRTVAEGRLASVPISSPELAPLLGATIGCTLAHRAPLEVIAWRHERRWSIRGSDSFESMTLLDGTTDDLAEVAEAARAWHDGAALSGIRRAAPFVHLTGRFEVPDLDPVRLTESAWQQLRTEASELEYPWRPAYQALVEAAHAEPALRRLYPFTSHWALRFSTTTCPHLCVVGPLLVTHDVDRYTVDRTVASEDGTQFTTAPEAVAAAVRELPPGLAPVTLGR
ncbi:DUF6193 family natural product biosynthesis protein [Streptomyces sp. fd1-xmd]|uniref:DUF6193 family natural product biosynthesis protein n=1 Tax=Streptomyces sp. fd1-xmd TaxID=1812480 RepID=UPI000990488F|nr:DUF6193 family natural product biosynthesis protein [Streptomyces sp. fd1-xmd]AQT70416.1 hypothetical protein B1K54_00340 [Streptomyces sp. fd1-xmd]